MKKIGNINIVVKNGDIATEPADCIVVPQFTYTASFNGVGHAIHYEGMTAGLEEYAKMTDKKTFQYGDSVITESGKPGIKLAHVATIDTTAEEQPVAIVKSIFNTMISAEKQNIQHIAIPELGTGIIGHLTQEQSAQTIFNAVYEFTKTNPNTIIKQVSLIIFKSSIEPALKVLKNKTYMKLPDNMTGSKEFNFAAFVYGKENHGICK